MCTSITKKYMNTAEATAVGYFGSAQSAMNLRAAKKGPRYYKNPGGRRIIYKIEDLEAWIRRGEIKVSNSIDDGHRKGGR